MSVTTSFLLRPRDPIVARDARPFSADPGARAFTLDWPLPSTIAGALRTHFGNSAATADWRSRDFRAQVHDVHIGGVFLAERGATAPGWTVYLPAPRDAVVYRPAGTKAVEIMALRPKEFDDGDGCNLPRVGDDELVPVEVSADEKPEPDYDYWSLADTIRWLKGEIVLPAVHRRHLPKESRVHVGVSSGTLTSEDGRLFATTGIAFSPASGERWKAEPETAILCRIEHPDDLGVDVQPAFLPLGGERRQVRMTAAEELASDPWTAPNDLVDALTGKTRVRLQLVTPALFRTGWYPGWLTQQHRDRVPEEVRGLGFRLRSAVVGRRIPISGWDLAHNCEKPTRYAAPAGSVYFCTVAAPLTAEQVRRLWLAPLSDGVYNRQDGFGLVVPGVWEA